MRLRRGHVVVAGVIALASLSARNASAQDVNVGAGASGSASTGSAPAAGGAATGAASAPSAPAAPAAPAATATTTTVTPSATTTTTVATSGEKKDDDDGMTDHERAVGHLAVGYLGVSQIPIAGGATGTGGTPTLTRDNVNAPVIGVRIWINKLLGIDGGLGFGWTSGSTETASPGLNRSVDKASRLGFAFHAGVPLALSSGKHYAFTVIPEFTVGLANSTIKSQTTPPGPDVELSGFRLDGGARVGAEIYFGFIGVPQLSLQGTVGLYYRRESYKYKTDTAAGTVSLSDGTNTVTTSVNADPWALFVNNISAFYYF